MKDRPDEPEPTRVEGVAHGELEDVELPNLPHVIFTVDYKIEYEYQFEHHGYEEEISWGKPEVVGASYMRLNDPEKRWVTVKNDMLFKRISEALDDSYSDAYEEDIRMAAQDEHGHLVRDRDYYYDDW